MKNFILLFSLMILLFACERVVRETGNGNMITKEHSVDNFEEVNVGGNFEIILRKGESPNVLVTADENLHEFITVEITGDRLEIETTKALSSDEGLTLEITYQQLSAVNVGGAATISSEETITGDYFSLSMSGAGAVNLDVDLKILKTSISGAGAVDLRGNADEHHIQLSGAGGLDAYELRSKTCEISISGVGSANIYVTEILKANVSGVGGISYKGDPQNITKDVAGLGSIEQVDGEENK